MSEQLTQIPFMPAADISALVKSREVSAREVANTMLDRIAAVDGAVSAYNEVTPELALAAADAVDAALAEGGDAAVALGELAGVPVAFKDNMNMVGTHTTCSSKMLANFQSPYDCTAVRRMLDAGTIPLGKLNMDEFAFGSSTETSAVGRTFNPWDLERVPGGSSGGSAAAVSAGLATITLGSDTGGSIRQPAAFTGTVGLKPSYGRVSRYGCVAFASSLDQIGPFSHTVRDNALAFSAIAGKDPLDATSLNLPEDDFVAACDAGATGDIKGMRVALATDLLEQEGLDPRLKAEVLQAAATLEAAGAEIVETTLPSTKYGLPAYYVLGPAEASSNLARFDGIRYGHRADDAEDVLDLYMRSRKEGFGPEVIRRIMIGTHVLSSGHYDAYYTKAQKVRTVIKNDYEAVFARADVLLTPTTPDLPFKFGQYDDNPTAMYLADYYTIPVNMAGIAGMSVPTSLIEGLPASVQIVANHGREVDLFRAGAALEAASAFPYASVPVASSGLV
ncbi:MAG: Asp-tRNA(Asn)/Glu-tRNA(Gln) amidotransferase subunit GatA [Coriobacteriia bacterium]|nr:Asp-tRNA(Asn)/Glu-tRNA(Gln) amidotransferase subunit GatA [Coriobacteriia bacterium]MCL2537023.1 Asp-tRNA(Asn)/Glu-tRNA(Gln) amidotransferase subunit GatA [Coriobacteriia bacterium]